jgi:tetratricopeptide (TPR) repeat protein
VSDVETLMQEGERLYREKRYDEAIAKFKMVVVRDPYNWRAWLWLCRTYIVRLLWSDAVEAGRQAFKLAPKGADVLPTFLQALFGGGLAALNSGNFRESISHFGEYLKVDSSNGAAWLNVGKAYLGSKQYGEALQSLIKALGVAGADRNEVISAMLSGGTQAFKERDYNGAVGMLREYVKQDPRNLQAYLTLAKSYWESGQRGGALEAFTQALRISPTNGEALQYMLKLR